MNVSHTRMIMEKYEMACVSFYTHNSKLYYRGQNQKIFPQIYKNKKKAI